MFSLITHYSLLLAQINIGQLISMAIVIQSAFDLAADDHFAQY